MDRDSIPAGKRSTLKSDQFSDSTRNDLLST
jgi:hypothetical protein